MTSTNSSLGYRLSPWQRRAWQGDRTGRGPASQSTIRLEGEVDRQRLRDAIRQVVRRHEILRTTFPRAAGMKYPLQVILESSEPQWRELDLTGQRGPRLDELCQLEAWQPFDLENGPVLRIALAAISPLLHFLVMSLPILCADQRTLDHLMAEIAGAYSSGPMEAQEDVLQYLQFSEWQNELAGEAAAAPEVVERAQIRPQDLTFPHELRSTGRNAWAPGRLRVPLEEGIVTRLAEVARGHGVASHEVLLCCWQVLLSKVTGCSEPEVGVLFDGRMLAELAGIFGLLARWLPIPSRCEPDLEFREVMARTHQGLSLAAQTQDQLTSSFFEDCGELPRFAAGFEAYDALPRHQAGRLSFAVEERRVYLERPKISLSWVPAAGRGSLELLYDASFLPDFVARRMGEQLGLILERALARPQTLVGRLDVLSPSERHWLELELNDTATDGAGESPSAALAKQGTAHPEEMALAIGTERWTWKQLDEQVDRLARRLRAAGVGPECLVGVCAERSFSLVTGLLAVLRSGGAYVPLDPSSPPARLRLILEDCGASVLLTQASHRQQFSAAGLEVISLEEVQGDAPGREDASPIPEPCPENLAYVIYTSGSSGRPKGVMVSRAGLEHYLAWATRAYAASAELGSVLHSPVAFDLAVTSLFVPLLAGKPLVLLPEDKGIEALDAALGTGVDFLKLTPAQLEMLAGFLPEDAAARISALVLGGEELRGESLAGWRRRSPRLRLINEYGPTETVVGCCVYEVPPGEPSPGPVPIGRPIANTRIYLLDGELQPVASGVPGELYIGGSGVARGYLRAPAQTATAFIPDRFGGLPGSRLYRTGDRARCLPDGRLEFLGRIDHQVKVRGFRIELGEIESQLAQHPAVRESVVIVREDVPGDRRLVAYWAPKAGSSPTVHDLRAFLRERLPEPMVPSAFVRLGELPLSRSGKIDRRALPHPGTERPDQSTRFVNPETAREAEMAQIWCEVLRVETVGAEDSFFDLGGHSLLATQLLAKVRSSFGVALGLEDFFRAPTVRSLTARLQEMLLDTVDSADLGEMLEALEALDEEEAQRLSTEATGGRSGRFGTGEEEVS